MVNCRAAASGAFGDVVSIGPDEIVKAFAHHARLRTNEQVNQGICFRLGFDLFFNFIRFGSFSDLAGKAWFWIN